MARPHVVVHVAVTLDGATTGFAPAIGLFYELAGTWAEDVTLAGADTILAQEPALREAPRVPAPAGAPLLAVVDGRGRVREWAALGAVGHWSGVLAFHADARGRDHLVALPDRALTVHVLAGCRRAIGLLLPGPAAHTEVVSPRCPGREGPMAVDMWVIWLIAAVGLIVLEIFTLTAAVGILGGAALVTALAAGVGLPVPVQLIVFSGAAVAGVVLLGPVARRHLTGPRGGAPFGVEALVGKPGYVLQEVTGRAGRVRIGGEEWTARTMDESLVIPAGATVGVLHIDGATAVVYPRE